MKTSNLIGAALDWAVAEARGLSKEWMHDYKIGYPVSSSTDWAQGGPIIERELIHVTHSHSRGSWKAYIANNGEDYFGPAPLIAAMRCYVASKLGDNVEIPKELK
jgi:hypothetical protein